MSLLEAMASGHCVVAPNAPTMNSGRLAWPDRTAVPAGPARLVRPLRRAGDGGTGARERHPRSPTLAHQYLRTAGIHLDPDRPMARRAAHMGPGSERLRASRGHDDFGCHHQPQHRRCARRDDAKRAGAERMRSRIHRHRPRIDRRVRRYHPPARGPARRLAHSARRNLCRRAGPRTRRLRDVPEPRGHAAIGGCAAPHGRAAPAEAQIVYGHHIQRHQDGSEEYRQAASFDVSGHGCIAGTWTATGSLAFRPYPRSPGVPGCSAACSPGPMASKTCCSKRDLWTCACSTAMRSFRSRTSPPLPANSGLTGFARYVAAAALDRLFAETAPPASILTRLGRMALRVVTLLDDTRRPGGRRRTVRARRGGPGLVRRLARRRRIAPDCRRLHNPGRSGMPSAEPDPPNL